MADFTWTDAATGKLLVRDCALEYACYGPDPAQTPTIVMLHEGLGSVGLWKDFPEKLATETGYGVFVYSRAGHGQSDPAPLPRPLDHATRQAQDVLPLVLDHIGIKNCVLLGHSDGATIAAIYAGIVPDDRLHGLVVIAPHFFTEPMGLAAIAEAKVAYETSDLRDRMARYHRDPDNCFWGWNDCWLDPDYEAWNVADVIDTIKVPVLAVQGRQDQYGTLAQIDEIATRINSPFEQAILEDCRHSPHLEQPGETLTRIVQFLMHHPPDPAGVDT